MRHGAIHLPDEASTHTLGEALGARLRVGDVVALAGPLGAGKTSLARGALAALGLAEDAPSPSFAIVIDYRPPDVRLPVGHVDLYRLHDPRELDELGLEDLADTGALLVEWPERAGAGRWPDALAITLEPLGAGGRRLTWEAPAAWDGRWPPAPR